MSRAYRGLLVLALASAPACSRDGDAAAPAAPDSTALAEDPRYIYGATGAENVRVVPVEIDVRGLPGGWSGMRIAALSDLHLGLWEDNESVALAAVRRALEERPDVVVLLGDYVGAGGDFAALDRVLAPLRGQQVFAVLGDRDEVDDPRGAVDSLRALTTQALQRNGVRVLRNERAPLVRGGDTAYIAGLEPYLPRRPQWRQAEIFRGIPGDSATPVLLAHMPVTGVTLPAAKYQALLSGHTFCGSVEVPGTPRLTWFNTEVVPGTADPARTRIYRLRGATVFATCGVGFSFVPMRFGAPPEVALVTLRGYGTARGDTARAPTMDTDSLLGVYQAQDSVSRAARDTSPSPPPEP